MNFLSSYKLGSEKVLAEMASVSWSFISKFRQTMIAEDLGYFFILHFKEFYHFISTFGIHPSTI